MREWVQIDEAGEAEASSFTVLSHNILAPMYTKQADVDMWLFMPEHLPWKRRAELMAADLCRLSPDILVMQEVERRMFAHWMAVSAGEVDVRDDDEDDALTKYIAEHGYEGEYVERDAERTDEEGSIDGNAVLFKRDRFETIATSTLDMRRHAEATLKDADPAVLARFANAGSRFSNSALFVLLRDVQTNNLVVVASTHLYFPHTHPDLKLWQAVQVVEALQRFLHSNGEVLWKVTGSAPPPVILCGDFNSFPWSGVYHYLDTGRVPTIHPDVQWDPTRYLSTLPLEHTLLLRSVYSHPVSLEHEARDFEAMPCPATHDGPNRTPRSHHEPPFTLWSPRDTGTVDYMWYTPPPHDGDLSPSTPTTPGGSKASASVTDGLRLTAFVPMPGIKDIEAPGAQPPYPGIPNATHGSDHLFLCARFCWMTNDDE